MTTSSRAIIGSILQQLKHRLAHCVADPVEPDRAAHVVVAEVRAGLLPLLEVLPPVRVQLLGGFVDQDEALEDAASRELLEEAGLSGILLTQMHTFGNPGRDPRGHTVSVVFVGYLPLDAVAKAGDDAAEAEWFTVDKLPDLAFDHEEVVEMAKSIFLV
jgi:8-oxo-dGTP pyrophosphatase MutT (NUDIX family)